LPRIPTYQQKRLPQPTSGVRVSPEAMTKDIEAAAGFGQAMAGAGDLAMQFAQKMQEAREVTEYNNNITNMDKIYNIFEENLNQDPDYTTYDKQFEDAQKKVGELRKEFTEPEAAKKWEEAFKKESEIRRHKMVGFKRRREILKMKGDLETNLIEAEKAGNLERALLILKSGELAGTIDSKPAAIRRESIKQNIDFYKASNLIMADPEAAIIAIKDRAEKIRQERIADKEKREIYEKTDRDFLVKVIKNELTTSDIKNALLTDTIDTTDAKFYRNILKSPDKEAFDIDTYTDLREAIIRNERPIDKIKKAYKEGNLNRARTLELLNKTYAKKLESGKDANLTRALSELKVLYTADVLGEKGTQEAAIKHLELSGKMEAWANDNPDATYKDFIEYFNILTEEEKTGWLNWLWDKMSMSIPGTSSWMEMVKRLSGEITERKEGETVEDYLERIK
jgi:hypothetical protein